MSMETWSARLPQEVVDQARADGAALGLDGTTAIIKAALEALHRAADLDAASRQIQEYYGQRAPLPLGVRPSRRRSTASDSADQADGAQRPVAGTVDRA